MQNYFKEKKEKNLKEELKLLNIIRNFLSCEDFLERIDYSKEDNPTLLIEEAIRYITVCRSYGGILGYLDSVKPSYGLDKYKRFIDYSVEIFGINKNVVNLAISDNALKSGLLFHGTNTSNINGILKNGLCSLSKFHEHDLKFETEKVNSLYRTICNRNIKNGISLPYLDPVFISSSETDRTDSIYLTSFFDTAVCYASNSNEWLRMYVKRILSNFGCSEGNIPWKEKEKIRKRIASELKSSGHLYDNEIDTFIGFFDKYYKSDGFEDDIYSQSVIIVPKHVDGVSFDFNSIASFATDFGVFMEPDEVKCLKPIPPEEILSITLDKQKKLIIK